MVKLIGKLLFPLVIFLYRSTGGRLGGKIGNMDVLLLTSTGRKSGKQRTLPLAYMRDGSTYVITASAGGAEKHPGWFFNVRSNPQATIDVKNQRISVTAEVAGPEEKSKLWTQLIAIAPGFAEYQKRTSRDIPMVILRPVNS